MFNLIVLEHSTHAPPDRTPRSRSTPPHVGGRGGGVGTNAGPELGPEAIGVRGHQLVGNDGAFDHVGEHRLTRPTLHTDRHHGTVGPVANTPAADGAVSTKETRRAPEARHDEAAPRHRTTERAGGGGELDGRGELHAPIMNAGCHSRRRPLDEVVSRNVRTRGSDPVDRPIRLPP